MPLSMYFSQDNSWAGPSPIVSSHPYGEKQNATWNDERNGLSNNHNIQQSIQRPIAKDNYNEGSKGTLF